MENSSAQSKREYYVLVDRLVHMAGEVAIDAENAAHAKGIALRLLREGREHCFDWSENEDVTDVIDVEVLGE